MTSVFPPRTFHFLGVMLFLFALFFVQLRILSGASSLWAQVDLVTVFVAYVSIEHFLGGAVIKAMAAALLLECFSAAPAGFYVMYYLVVLVCGNILARRLALHNVLSQLAAFVAILALKLVLLYVLFWVQGRPLPLAALARFLPSLLSTVLCAMPLLGVFSRFDALFEFLPVKERRTHEAQA